MQRYFIKSEEVASRLESRESWFDGRVLDASGFLVYSEVFAFKTLPEIAEEGNAIIVAEGGMGKSFVLREFYKGHEDDIELINVVYFESNVPRLESIIEKAADKKYIFIDGLDEASSLCPALIGILKRTKISAHVLLASRSIPQLKSFCATLKWAMYSLLPYTRGDVKELCEEVNKDFNAFMREVDGHGLGSVCAKPLGCNMLLASFDGKVLPSKSGEDLWRNSLKRLCAENDGSDTRPLVASSNVTPDECWRIASRVALALKLAKQSVLPRRSSTVVFEGGEIDVSQVLSAEDGSKFNECLIRSIFTSIGDGRFRFSHSSYFDFMAAMGVVEYIKQSEWGKLVFSPEGVPYPLWEGVLPWLAARDGALLERVKKCRPDLLLGSDAVVNKVGAEVICRCILDNAANVPRTIRENPAIQARYYALSTNGCVAVVVDALKNGQTEEVVDTAIDIARRAHLVPMVDALVDFFCDSRKDLSLRISAGYALLDLANIDQRKKCRAVLSAKMPQRLKGLALRLLWPDNMTVQELVPLLTPEDDGVLDSYEWWLGDEFVKTLDQLSEEDVRELLKWAISDIKQGDHVAYHFNTAKREVFLHCWLKLDSPDFLELLARGLAVFADIHASPFMAHSKCKPDEYGKKSCFVDSERRRRMAKFIVENEDLPLKPLTSFSIQLLQYSDIDYVLCEMKASNIAVHRNRWAKCLVRLAGGIELPKRSDVWNWLHQNFSDIFTLDANAALLERRKYDRQMKRIQYRGRDRKESRGLKQEEIRAKNATWVHDMLTNGKPSSRFPQIMWVFASQTQGGVTDFRLDFRKSALWPTLSKEEIASLVKGAYDFILMCKGPWSKENECYPSYVQAFYLLMAYDKEKLDSLPPEAWRKFAPELLQALNFDTFDLVPLTLRFFAGCQPEIFFEELASKFKKQLDGGRSVELYKFKSIIQPDVLRRLLLALDSDDLADKQRRNLYDEFWRADPHQTAECINVRWPATMSIRDVGVDSSVYLLAGAPGKRFPELLSLLRQDPKWGCCWAEKVLGQEDYHNCTVAGMLKCLSVSELKEFYAWLIENFPPEDAPNHVGCFTPSAADNLYQFISHVFSELVSRVDVGLPPALEDLSNRFPRLRFLKESILQARRMLLEKDCPVYDVGVIKKMLSQKYDGVIVNTPDDLMEVVLCALKKYQTYLTGVEAPQVFGLWNDLEDGVSHKNEETFSGHIKSFMDRELSNIVINREVQLNRGNKEQSGARTDIWVTAISESNNTRLRLCIEVKGSWNKTCRTAFREQLCGKYMGDGGADAGVFLVGWFHSSRCKKNDHVWESMDAIQECLKSQGDALRKEGFSVCPMVIDCSY